jgi:hypothetical protein
MVFSDVHLGRPQLRTAISFICCPDCCDASSSRRSVAGYSTERSPVFDDARSDTAGTSGLRWRPSCDSPCGPCRNNACCSRLAYLRGSSRLVGLQRPPWQQVRQGQRSEEVNSDIGMHDANGSPLARDSHFTKPR